MLDCLKVEHSGFSSVPFSNSDEKMKVNTLTVSYSECNIGYSLSRPTAILALIIGVL